MAIYTMNPAGSAVITVPSNIIVGDVLRFNRTSVGATGTILTYTIPEDGVYQISALGATGGKVTGTVFVGGKGSRMQGNFTLTKGTVLKILVGQLGGNNTVPASDNNYLGSGGGGGGTFVATSANLPLIIAGGGGGARYYYYDDPNRVGTGFNGSDASVSTTGTGTVPGVDGQGSLYASSAGNGGGGFYSDATPATSWGKAGIGFTNGGLGGVEARASGGFGGGGSTSFSGGGGGGGYSGGGAGGGGGSYNGGTSPSNTINTTEVHGLVEITVIEIDKGAVIFPRINGVVREYVSGWVRIEGALRSLDSGVSGPVTFNANGSNHTGTIQNWTVPESGEYVIEAYGAEGGTGLAGALGGKGARMKGTFTLTKGDLLKILVGQKPITGTTVNSGGGGGGGSFVVRGTSTPLLVAGGGGGGDYRTNPGSGAPVTSSGLAGYNAATTAGGGAGGVGGAGGAAGTSYGAGGGGINGNGVDSATVGSGGKSFINGGQGGIGSYGNGGFGGGGGVQHAGGGGGGYSGGGGGAGNFAGGGGGSYNAGTSPSNTASIRSGNGLVQITPIYVPGIWVRVNGSLRKVEIPV